MSNNYEYLFSDKRDTDWFRSEVCHLLKNKGDKEFLRIVLHHHMIEQFWQKKKYFQCLYLVSMVDCISFDHNVPEFKDLDFYRKQKMSELIYPISVIMLDKLNPEEYIKTHIFKECEQSVYGRIFLRHNIIERSIRDVA